MQQLVYERAKTLLEAEFGDELVALDAADGVCFGFNDVAATVWRVLERPCTLADLKRALMQEYDVGPAQCETDVKDLLSVMVERHLISSRLAEL